VKRTMVGSLLKEPDVVLMDIGMPELNGLEATRQIRKYVAATKILVLSGYDNDEYIREIMHSGANGYLLKSAAPAELISAIIAVSKGHNFFGASNSDHGTRKFQARSDSSSSPRTECFEEKDRLTQREREVLQLIAEGKQHSQIALILHISIRTVDTHRNNILKKLGLHDAAGLVTYAIKNSIVILPR
jgi:DNA-binding NarL/FixJ family response regulator